MDSNNDMWARRRMLGVLAVLDDDQSFREALVAALLSLGYLAVEFGTPEALLAVIHQLLPACLLVDLDLSGMSGLDVYRLLVSDGLSIPTIFVTANVDAGMNRRIMAAGAFACLSKPAPIGQLDDLILKAISG